MLLVKKCQFFLHLFMVKTRQEIRFINFLDRTETISDYSRKISKSPNNQMFPKGLPMLLVKKCQFFLYLFLVKT